MNHHKIGDAITKTCLKFYGGPRVREGAEVGSWEWESGPVGPVGMVFQAVGTS